MGSLPSYKLSFCGVQGTTAPDYGICGKDCTGFSALDVTIPTLKHIAKHRSLWKDQVPPEELENWEYFYLKGVKQTLAESEQAWINSFERYWQKTCKRTAGQELFGWVPAVLAAPLPKDRMEAFLVRHLNYKEHPEYTSRFVLHEATKYGAPFLFATEKAALGPTNYLLLNKVQAGVASRERIAAFESFQQAVPKIDSQLNSVVSFDNRQNVSNILFRNDVDLQITRIMTVRQQLFQHNSRFATAVVLDSPTTATATSTRDDGTVTFKLQCRPSNSSFVLEHTGEGPRKGERRTFLDAENMKRFVADPDFNINKWELQRDPSLPEFPIEQIEKSVNRQIEVYCCISVHKDNPTWGALYRKAIEHMWPWHGEQYAHETRVKDAAPDELILLVGLGYLRVHCLCQLHAQDLQDAREDELAETEKCSVASQYTIGYLTDSCEIEWVPKVSKQLIHIAILMIIRKSRMRLMKKTYNTRKIRRYLGSVC